MAKRLVYCLVLFLVYTVPSISEIRYFYSEMMSLGGDSNYSKGEFIAPGSKTPIQFKFWDQDGKPIVLPLQVQGVSLNTDSYIHSYDGSFWIIPVNTKKTFWVSAKADSLSFTDNQYILFSKGLPWIDSLRDSPPKEAVSIFVPTSPAGYEGTVGNSIQWQTTTSHIGRVSNKINVELFDPEGKSIDMVVTILGNNPILTNKFEFNLFVNKIVCYQISNNGSVVSGYTKISTDARWNPITESFVPDTLVSVFYDRKDSAGKTLSALGVDVVSPTDSFIVPGVKMAEVKDFISQDLALVILNVNDSDIDVKIEVYSQFKPGPAFPGTVFLENTVHVPAKSKITSFLYQLLNLKPGDGVNDGGGEKITSGYVKIYSADGKIFSLTALTAIMDANFLMYGVPSNPVIK